MRSQPNDFEVRVVVVNIVIVVLIFVAIHIILGLVMVNKSSTDPL